MEETVKVHGAQVADMKAELAYEPRERKATQVRGQLEAQKMANAVGDQQKETEKEKAELESHRAKQTRSVLTPSRRQTEAERRKLKIDEIRRELEAHRAKQTRSVLTPSRRQTEA